MKVVCRGFKMTACSSNIDWWSWVSIPCEQPSPANSIFTHGISGSTAITCVYVPITSAKNRINIYMWSSKISHKPVNVMLTLATCPGSTIPVGGSIVKFSIVSVFPGLLSGSRMLKKV